MERIQMTTVFIGRFKVYVCYIEPNVVLRKTRKGRFLITEEVQEGESKESFSMDSMDAHHPIQNIQSIAPVTRDNAILKSERKGRFLITDMPCRLARCEKDAQNTLPKVVPN
jgi:hypothetical protein